MKKIFLLFTILASINIAFAQQPIDKAIKTFETTVGADVQKTFSQYGDLIDFAYFDKENSRYSYLTVKSMGSIVCKSTDAEEEDFPANIKTKIQTLYPKEYKKGWIGNYRIGTDSKNNPVYIFIITSKDDDTIVIMNKVGTKLYSYEME